jgi:SAM-dependent methyltransferase
MNKPDWVAYIDKTGTHVHDLHLISKLLWANQKNKRALSIGSGAGNDAVNLLENKWDVTCVDIEPYSEIAIKSRTKKKFKFQNASFENIVFDGKYSYVSAYNAFPFGDKKYLRKIVDTIYKHLVKGGVFALTLFSNTHTFVKNKTCYSVTKEYISKLFANYELIWCDKNEQDLKRKFGIVHWSAYDIIAIKK